nr:heme attachment to plastid cytochrome c [Elakatothrix viridis]
MNFILSENLCSNLSFLLLFLSMIFYWIQITFGLVWNHLNLGKMSMIFANIFLTILLLTRWINSGHVPLSNLYESLMFLSWSLSMMHLILEEFVPNPFLTCITSPVPLFSNAFATFSLSSGMQKASALVPALQSNWLMMHVTVMLFSYASLLLGSLIALAFLVLTENFNVEANNTDIPIFSGVEPNLKSVNSSNIVKQLGFQNHFFKKSISNIVVDSLSLVTSNNDQNFKNLSLVLDNLSYRILGIGFPFLTLGILSGAVWANESWGSYWSWDPKETWALLTWFVFAIYLHTRLTKGWKGKKPALIASIGFFTVWICFLGVNLLGEGLHSYGWVS